MQHIVEPTLAQFEQNRQHCKTIGVHQHQYLSSVLSLSLSLPLPLSYTHTHAHARRHAGTHAHTRLRTCSRKRTTTTQHSTAQHNTRNQRHKQATNSYMPTNSRHAGLDFIAAVSAAWRLVQLRELIGSGEHQGIVVLAEPCRATLQQTAMGQNPVPSVNIPIPTKMD